MNLINIQTRSGNRLQKLALLPLLITPLVVATPLLAANTEVEAVVESGKVRLKENQQAQVAVSKESDKTLTLIEQYWETLKSVEDLNAYNGMMTRQVNRQVEEMDQLRTSINDVSVIERNMLPLLTRMLDGLEVFVELDLPFQLDERRNRVVKLREMLERVDVSVAEKARRVFEAYQIENDYGRTIDAYRNKLALHNGVFDVDFLRIGRTSLMYRTVGNENIGYWDNQKKQWVEVNNNLSKRQFEQGTKIARRETAPELMTVPVVLGGEI